MKNDNIIDFVAYYRRHYKNADIGTLKHSPIEEELTTAIQNLIQRLREHDPLKQIG